MRGQKKKSLFYLQEQNNNFWALGPDASHDIPDTVEQLFKNVSPLETWDDGR